MFNLTFAYVRETDTITSAEDHTTLVVRSGEPNGSSLHLVLSSDPTERITAIDAMSRALLDMRVSAVRRRDEVAVKRRETIHALEPVGPLQERMYIEPEPPIEQH